MVQRREGFVVFRHERRFLMWAVVVSVAIHIAGIGVMERLQPTSEEVAQRVLFVTPTVGGKFVMRAPRVTKRLEFRKVPRESGGKIGRGEVVVVQEGPVSRRILSVESVLMMFG